MALALAAALALPAASYATTVHPVSVAELTRGSDDVVLATVRRSMSHWEEGFIVTDHEIEVVSALKGRLASRALVMVRLAGGTVGSISQMIPEAPSLEVGRTYVLFLAGGVSTVRYLAHLTAAVVPVALAPTGSVQASVPGTLRIAPASTGPASATTVMSLDQVARAVRSVTP